jgi:hypothetical protein
MPFPRWLAEPCFPLQLLIDLLLENEDCADDVESPWLPDLKEMKAYHALSEHRALVGWWS